MPLFRFLLGVDAVIAAVVLAFFVIGLGDGSISAVNLWFWLVVLAGVALIIGGGLKLRARGQMMAARLVLMVLAGPGIGAGLLLLTAVVLQPQFH